MFSPICKDFKLNLCNNKQMESCGQCALHLLSRTWQESRSREITQSFFSRAGELNFDATFSSQFSRFRERENSLSPLASWDFFYRLILSFSGDPLPNIWPLLRTSEAEVFLHLESKIGAVRSGQIDKLIKTQKVEKTVGPKGGVGTLPILVK